MIEKRSGIILAWQNGRRTDEVLEKLLAKVAQLPIPIGHTDQWRAYSRLFPSEYFHIVCKDNTRKIERKNLNFRIHLKRLSQRTIRFSKNETIQTMSLGCISKNNYFKHRQFAEAFRA